MSITKERFQHFFDKLTYEKLLAEKKLEFFLNNPNDFIKYLEIEEEYKKCNDDMISAIDATFKRIEEREINALERMILGTDQDDD